MIKTVTFSLIGIFSNLFPIFLVSNMKFNSPIYLTSVNVIYFDSDIQKKKRKKNLTKKPAKYMNKTLFPPRVYDVCGMFDVAISLVCASPFLSPLPPFFKNFSPPSPLIIISISSGNHRPTCHSTCEPSSKFLMTFPPFVIDPSKSYTRHPMKLDGFISKFVTIPSVA